MRASGGHLVLAGRRVAHLARVRTKVVHARRSRLLGTIAPAIGRGVQVHAIWLEHRRSRGHVIALQPRCRGAREEQQCGRAEEPRVVVRVSREMGAA